MNTLPNFQRDGMATISGNTLPDDTREKILDDYTKVLAIKVPQSYTHQVLLAMTEYAISYAKAYAPVLENDKVKKLKHALEYLMQGVSGLPPLTAIEGVLIPHYETAKAALEFVALAAPVPGKEEMYRVALEEISKGYNGHASGRLINIAKKALTASPSTASNEEEKIWEETGFGIGQPSNEDKAVQQAAKEYAEKEWQEKDDAVLTFTGKALKESSVEDFLAGASFNSDAVEFAEWIAVKEYITTTLPHEDVQLWQYNHYDRENDKLTEGQEITTQELYNLFKQIGQ